MSKGTNGVGLSSQEKGEDVKTRTNLKTTDNEKENKKRLVSFGTAKKAMNTNKT